MAILIKEVDILMLESPRAFFKPDVRFEGEQGNLSKATCIAVFNETAIFGAACNAMPQIFTKIQILKSGRLNLGITEAVEFFKSGGRGCEIQKRFMQPPLNHCSH